MRRRLLIAGVLLAAAGAAVWWFLPETGEPADLPVLLINAAKTGPHFSTVPWEKIRGNAPVDSVRAEVEDAEDCPEKPAPYLTGQSEEEFESWFVALADTLAETVDADYLLAAALLSQSLGPDRSLELLVRAAEIAPQNRLVAWNRLTKCPSAQSIRCDRESIEAKAISVDGSNGAVWAELAMRRVGKRRNSEAIAAIRRAIAAPRFDSYFIDHVTVLELALASRNDLSYRQRYFMAMGYSAALAVPSYRITKHCETVAESVGVWVELCDQLGAKMFADGRTLLDQAIGRALQKIAAGRSGDDEWIERSTADYEAFREQYQKLIADRNSQALLENDEVVLRQYVENFATYGELEAQYRLKAEAQRLREDPDYDQCNFVSNWATQ